jgi:Tfp pilus assembly protein FimV
MTESAPLSAEQLVRVRAAAALLLPGSAEAQAPTVLPDFEQQLQHAAAALEGGDNALATAIDALPAKPTWQNLSALAEADPASFGQASLLVVGAFFMSPSVLASLGLPTGERRPAPREQVVDELDGGILDAVLERGCPVRTLDEVNARSVR